MSSKKLKTDYVASIIYIAGGKNFIKKPKKTTAAENYAPCSFIIIAVFTTTLTVAQMLQCCLSLFACLSSVTYVLWLNGAFYQKTVRSK